MPVFHEEHHSAATPADRDPYRAFREREYTWYTAGNFLPPFGRQMLGMVVAYEIHKRTHSATALGLIGLVGALPIIFLALPAGQMADRANRRSLIIVTQLLGIVTSLALAWLSWKADLIPSWPSLAWGSRALQWAAVHMGEKSGTIFGPEIPLFFLLLL